MPPSRSRKCTYRENGRRCPFDGTGDPRLCRAHQIALQEAARPRRPIEVVADAFVNFLQGKPINADATIGAVDSLINEWGGMGSDYRPDVAPGESEDTAHRRARSGQQRPDPRWWWNIPGAGPGRQHQGDPQADARRIQLAARRVMGFAASEPLTPDLIKDRKKTLAKKHHPDRPGGSVEKMSAINAAADVLIQSL